MIPTVLGPIEPSAVTGKCSPHEHLLAKPPGMTPGTLAKIHEDPITLSNLGAIRSQPEGSCASDRLLSLDEIVQELGDLTSAGGTRALVLDCTSADQGRHPAGLVDVAKRTGVHVVMAASWRQGGGPSGSETAENIGAELEQQLLLGEKVADMVSSSSGARSDSSRGASATRVQAGFIAVRLDERDTGERNRGRQEQQLAAEPAEGSLVLRGAILAHKKTGAPIIIQFPAFCQDYSPATAAFSSAESTANDPGAGCGKVVLTGMVGGSGRPIAGQIELLERGFVLCFDCFGRVEWLPGPDYYPSDEENAVRIAELVKLGFVKQIIVSQGVSRRIHLSRYGGFGYGHALRTLLPRLARLGLSTDDITAITRTNTLDLLDWYTPPPPPEIPKNYLPCSMCQTRFEPIDGEYFHKFQFVYCGVKCLRAHRDGGFKTIPDRS